jgi:hypothetical protein
MTAEIPREESPISEVDEQLLARRRAFPHGGYASLLKEVGVIICLLAIASFYALYQAGLL